MKTMTRLAVLIVVALGGCASVPESVMNIMEEMDPLKVPEYRQNIPNARLSKLFQMSTRNNEIGFAMTSGHFYVSIDGRLEAYSLPSFTISKTFRFRGLTLKALNKTMDVRYSIILAKRDPAESQAYDDLRPDEALYFCVREEDLSIAWRLRVANRDLLTGEDGGNPKYFTIGASSFINLQFNGFCLTVDLMTGKKHIQDGVSSLKLMTNIDKFGIMASRYNGQDQRNLIECRDETFKLCWVKPLGQQEEAEGAQMMRGFPEQFFMTSANGSPQVKSFDSNGRGLWNCEIFDSESIYFDARNRQIVFAQNQGNNTIILVSVNPGTGEILWKSKPHGIDGKFTLVPDPKHYQAIIYNNRILASFDLKSGMLIWKTKIGLPKDLHLFSGRDDFVIAGNRLFFSVLEKKRYVCGTTRRTDYKGRKGYSINILSGSDLQIHAIAPDFAWHRVVFSIDGGIARFDHKIWWVDKSEAFAVSLDDLNLCGRFLVYAKLGTVIDLAKWLIVPIKHFPKDIKIIEVISNPSDIDPEFTKLNPMFTGVLIVANGLNGTGSDWDSDGCLQVWSVK